MSAVVGEVFLLPAELGQHATAELEVILLLKLFLLLLLPLAAVSIEACGCVWGALGALSEGVEGVTVNRGTCNCSVVPCE